MERLCEHQVRGSVSEQLARSSTRPELELFVDLEFEQPAEAIEPGSMGYLTPAEVYQHGQEDI